MNAIPSGPKGGTDAAETSRRHLVAAVRLSSSVLAKREQAEGKEQQGQENHMAGADDEHDHGNRKANSKQTHQQTPF
jgi:hypothetical protein